MTDKSPPTSLWGRDVLSEREELLREAEQIANVGSWAWDMKTGKVAWSDELYRILGRDPEKDAATFENFIEAIHPDDRMSVQALAQRASAGEVAERAEYRVVRRDGTIREIAGLAQIFRDEQGIPLRMVGVAMDMTEIRKLEQALHHAQKMEALGRIAGGLAHDFNNLLTVILLNASSLQRTAGASRELQQIHDAASSATQLATRLLAFSRRSPRAPRPLDLNMIVAQSIEMLERLTTEDLRIEFLPSKDPATVVADESQMHQVLLNLALNARDAMPDGGKVAFVVERVKHARGLFVCISVTDTGTGMSEATRARLFEPFFTTKEPGKGTGLGLAIVFGIVTQSNGFIEVESEVGRGSTFRIHFPYVEGALPVRPVMEPPRPAGEIVLVVEDSDDVRAVVARILGDAGFEVVEAARPSQAIEHFERLGSRLAVVVSDLAMPEMNGRDLARQMRETLPRLPIVFLTGYDPGPAGLDDERTWYLTKPVSESTLLTHVRRALTKR